MFEFVNVFLWNYLGSLFSNGHLNRFQVFQSAYLIPDSKVATNSFLLYEGLSVQSQLLPPPISPLGFSKNASSKERVKSWFFVNIIITHLFPEMFIQIPQVVQKIWRLSPPILVIFSDFHPIFWICWHFPVTKKLNDISLKEIMSVFFHFQHT